jgi:predicted TIM-barrel fold metal-dependent hydrolase
VEIIDAYTHCGLSKYEPVEQVARAMAATGVSRAVLVQHLGEFDNSYIGECVAAEPSRYAGVCLVDHTRPDSVKQLEEHANSGRFRGVRFPANALIESPQLFDAAARLDLVMALYAPDGMANVADALQRLLETREHARIVMTHLGTPNMAEAPEFPSARAAFRLAEYSGVYWQLSGMKMYCPWPHEPLHRLVADGVEAFGPEHVLWGSNYPVVGNEVDYQRDLELLTGGWLPIPREAIPSIAGGNARRLWFRDRVASD